MQRFSLFVPHLRPMTVPSGAAFSHPPPAPLPSEKTGDTASIVTKTHTLSNSVSIHSLMRAAV